MVSTGPTTTSLSASVTICAIVLLAIMVCGVVVYQLVSPGLARSDRGRTLVVLVMGPSVLIACVLLGWDPALFVASLRLASGN